MEHVQKYIKIIIKTIEHLQNIYSWLPIESNMSNRMQKRHEWNMTESNRDSSNCSTVRMECDRIESFYCKNLSFRISFGCLRIFFECYLLRKKRASVRCSFIEFGCFCHIFSADLPHWVDLVCINFVWVCLIVFCVFLLIIRHNYMKWTIISIM